MAITDTSPRVAAIQLERYRAISASARVQIAVDLSDAVRETALAGIRRRHPEYSDQQVAEAFLQMVYGVDAIARTARQSAQLRGATRKP